MWMSTFSAYFFKTANLLLSGDIRMKKCFLILLMLSAFLPSRVPAEPFSIGAVLPLSGPAAEYGASIVNAIEMARRDHPALFENVVFKFEDGRYDASAAVTAFHKLTRIDRVDLVFTWGISFCQALAPLAEERKIPLIAECPDPGLSRNRRFVLRPMNDSDQYTKLTAEYLAAKGLRKLGLILSDTNYTEMMSDSLRRMLQPGQSVTLVDSLSASDMDFRSSIAKLRTGDFDAVGVFLSVGQVGQFFRQAKQQRLEIPAFGTNVFESFSEIRGAGSAMDGAIYAFNSVGSAFISRYISLYGGGSQLGFAAVAYEVMARLGEAVSSNSSLRGEALLRSFDTRNTRESPVTGPYKVLDLDESLFFDFPLVIKEVRGGDVREVRGWGAAARKY